MSRAFSSFDSLQFCTFLSITSWCWEWWWWWSTAAALAATTSSKSDCKDINNLQPSLSVVLAASLRKKWPSQTPSRQLHHSTAFFIFSTGNRNTHHNLHELHARASRKQDTVRQNGGWNGMERRMKVPCMNRPNWSLISKWQFNSILLTWSNACARWRLFFVNNDLIFNYANDVKSNTSEWVCVTKLSLSLNIQSKCPIDHFSSTSSIFAVHAGPLIHFSIQFQFQCDSIDLSI